MENPVEWFKGLPTKGKVAVAAGGVGVVLLIWQPWKKAQAQTSGYDPAYGVGWPDTSSGGGSLWPKTPDTPKTPETPTTPEPPQTPELPTPPAPDPVPPPAAYVPPVAAYVPPVAAYVPPVAAYVPPVAARPALPSGYSYDAAGSVYNANGEMVGGTHYTPAPAYSAPAIVVPQGTTHFAPAPGSAPGTVGPPINVGPVNQPLFNDNFINSEHDRLQGRIFEIDKLIAGGRTTEQAVEEYNRRPDAILPIFSIGGPTYNPAQQPPSAPSNTGPDYHDEQGRPVFVFH